MSDGLLNLAKRKNTESFRPRSCPECSQKIKTDEMLTSFSPPRCCWSPDQQQKRKNLPTGRQALRTAVLSTDDECLYLQFATQDQLPAMRRDRLQKLSFDYL